MSTNSYVIKPDKLTLMKVLKWELMFNVFYPYNYTMFVPAKVNYQQLPIASNKSYNLIKKSIEYFFLI